MRYQVEVANELEPSDREHHPEKEQLGVPLRIAHAIKNIVMAFEGVRY